MSVAIPDANSASMLVVHPSMPAKSVRELIALARPRPDEIRFGTGGAGSVGHLVSEMFQATHFAEVAIEPAGGASEKFAAHLAAEFRKWDKVAKDAGIKLD